MITYVAKVTEDTNEQARTIKLEEGMIWTIQGKGTYGYYDDSIYRMIPYLIDGFLRFKKSDTSYSIHEFNEYITGGK